MSAKVACVVCGYRTLGARADWDICPICFWEDDVIIDDRQDAKSPANGDMWVSEAQANFVTIGACRPEHSQNVRSPTDEDERVEGFQLLPATLRILKTQRDR